MRSIWKYGCVIALALQVGAAHAQPSNAVAAETLFQDAQKLFAADDYAAACPKFKASYELDPGLGTLLNLARCYEAEGRTASAWIAYVDLGSKAARAGQADRAAIAKERVAALEPTLTRVVMQVREPAEGQELLLDGEPVLPALYGTAVPIDPGEHVLTANAVGRHSWSKTLTAEASTTLTVEVPALLPRPTIDDRELAPMPVPPLPPVGLAPLPQPLPDDAGAGAGPALLISGAAVSGIGLVVLAVGGGFAADASSAWSDAGCSGGLCPDAASQALSEQASSSAATATGLMVGGGVTLGVGALLLILGATSGPGDAADASVTPTVGLTADGVRFRF